MTIWGLRKHLRGALPRGHALSEAQAAAVADEAAASAAPLPALVPKLSLPDTPMPSADAYLRALFERLGADRLLPKYQFERRVDAMLAMFLPELVAQLYGGTVEFVVPEFPLKKSANLRTSNVDALLRHVAPDGTGSWLFVELKTDSQSINDDQKTSYRAAVERGMAGLLEDLLKVRDGSDETQKYEALQSRLAGSPESASWPIRVLYVAPVRIDARELGPGGRSVTLAELARLDLKEHGDVWHVFRELLRGGPDRNS